MYESLKGKNVQLLLQCGGQVLAIAFALLVWGVWTLLQDYRDAIIWAVLCSVTLRDFKEYLTTQILLTLNTDRYIVLCL